MRRLRGMLLVGAPVVATLVSALGATAQEAPDPAEQATILPDIAWYASAFGVSYEEAEARDATIELARTLQDELRASGDEAFGGVWIDHEPDFRVVVNAVSGREGQVEDEISKLGLDAVADVVSVKFTEGELYDQQQAMTNKLPMKVSYATGIDIRSGRVMLYVFSGEDKTSLEQARLGSAVDVVERSAPMTPAQTVYGGLPISNGCTSGFSIQSISSPSIEGITTAGHCGNTVSWNGTNLPFQDGQVSGKVDGQWHTSPGLSDPNVIRVSSDGTTRLISSRRHRSEMMVGDNVCKYGRITHYDCGTIDDVSYGSESCVPGSSPPNNTYIYVNNTGGDLTDEGDSGGPVFKNNRAWGSVNCGQDEDNPPGSDNGDMVFMAQNFFGTFNIQVDIS